MKQNQSKVGWQGRGPVVRVLALATMLAFGCGVAGCSDEDVDEEDGCSYELDDVLDEADCNEQAVEFACEESTFSADTETCILDGCDICI